MRFFDKEKDLIHRIINLIFIIWVIATLVICYDGIINILVKKPLLSYSEYKERTCNFADCIEEDTTKCMPNTNDESYCKNMYYSYKNNIEETNKRYLRQTFSSLLSGLTVGVTLYLLNKRQRNTKEAH